MFRTPRAALRAPSAIPPAAPVDRPPPLIDEVETLLKALTTKPERLAAHDDYTIHLDLPETLSRQCATLPPEDKTMFSNALSHRLGTLQNEIDQAEASGNEPRKQRALMAHLILSSLLDRPDDLIQQLSDRVKENHRYPDMSYPPLSSPYFNSLQPNHAAMADDHGTVGRVFLFAGASDLTGLSPGRSNDVLKQNSTEPIDIQARSDMLKNAIFGLPTLDAPDMYSIYLALEELARTKPIYENASS
jgi:hypothetical protein